MKNTVVLNAKPYGNLGVRQTLAADGILKADILCPFITNTGVDTYLQ